jgi:hypothetical protein
LASSCYRIDGNFFDDFPSDTGSSSALDTNGQSVDGYLKTALGAMIVEAVEQEAGSATFSHCRGGEGVTALDNTFDL